MVATAPGYVYRQIPINYTVQTSMASRSKGLILHVATGGNFSLYGWFSQARARASSHWWAGYNPGQREQYLDPDRMRSWAQAAGNSTYHSIETAGDPDAPLTPGQVESCAQLYAWGHQRYGWPFRLAERPGEPGFGWHGMGGTAWGGHNGCPGDLRKAQRPAILARAQQIAGSSGLSSGGAGGMGGGGPTPTPAPAPTVAPTSPTPPPGDDDQMLTQEAQDWIGGKLGSVIDQLNHKIDTGVPYAIENARIVTATNGEQWTVAHMLAWLMGAAVDQAGEIAALQAALSSVAGKTGITDADLAKIMSAARDGAVQGIDAKIAGATTVLTTTPGGTS